MGTHRHLLTDTATVAHTLVVHTPTATAHPHMDTDPTLTHLLVFTAAIGVEVTGTGLTVTAIEDTDTEAMVTEAHTATAIEAVTATVGVMATEVGTPAGAGSAGAEWAVLPDDPAATARMAAAVTDR